MKRLTESDDLGNWAVKGLPWENLHEGQVITRETWEKLYGCLYKLKDYEEGNICDPCEYQKALELAVKALEKQTAKKPTYDGDGYAPDGSFVWDEWLCPNCGSRFEVDYDEYDYCPNCGQKIDWNEEPTSKRPDHMLECAEGVE